MGVNKAAPGSGLPEASLTVPLPYSRRLDCGATSTRKVNVYVSNGTLPCVACLMAKLRRVSQPPLVVESGSTGS